MTKKYQIAVIPGDGIGEEVMPEGLRVLEAVASKFSIDIQFNHHDQSILYIKADAVFVKVFV